ncbi:CAP domain-containing protein [Chelatococcus caeni]|nr:CAP domain-containing protein [Chelatococcus caeni]
MTMVNDLPVRRLLRRALAAAPLALLAACSSPPPDTQQPAFYRSLASAGASVDAASAAGMISAYRRNHGLPPVAVDAALQREAQAEAERMATADRPSSADAVKQRLAAAGVASPAVNLSAGYHTVAEAFSGWRESPQHDRTMLAPGATRLGIATAYAPGSKYKVYWALIVASP